MMRNAGVKAAGYSLCVLTPMLAVLGIALGLPWLSPIVVFGVFPLLGLLIGEDRSSPLLNIERKPALKMYLEMMPRLYAIVWMVTLWWGCGHAARTQLSTVDLAALIVSLGLASALAICTAHELLHRRCTYDILLARVMTTLCFYGHMLNDHLHHHATVGTFEYGSTARPGTSVYRFAFSDYLTSFRNAWAVEAGRVKRCSLAWWRNQVSQACIAVAVCTGLFFIAWGPLGLIVLITQAAFAVFAFEVITYVHHYGLQRSDTEELGPHHAWAHHCWLTNCLTFNNTFHSDHHLRPRTPYYQLHAMYAAPRLPASYFSMFWVALVPPLWYRLIDPRLDALQRARAADWLLTQQCR